MKPQILKIQIGEAIFIISFMKVRGGYSYDIRRNKKTFVCGYAPSSFKDNIKMTLLEHLTIQGTYQLSHEIGKLKI